MQEFNSVEAIKSAVQYGLGAAFVSSAAISKEMDLGLFKRVDIEDVRLTRMLSLVRPSWREPLCLWLLLTCSCLHDSSICCFTCTLSLVHPTMHQPCAFNRLFDHIVLYGF